MIVLGIESSCDETAASIVAQIDGRTKVLSNIIASQIKEHTPYGGVVPEIAARSHVEKIDIVIKSALYEAGIEVSQIDGIAATSGPGLIGGVMVGLLSAKALCVGTGLPLLAVNHLEGHALSPRLSQDVEFPYLLLLVSGGHCQILKVSGIGQYQRLGTSIDDALGECFDKVAKILGLGYPGGPLVEARAKLGNAKRFEFPRPLIGRAGCDFSFAGLKTAVLRQVENLCIDGAKLSEADINDICASFQNTISRILINRLENAFIMSGLEGDDCRLVLAGGVAANQNIRQNLIEFCNQKNWKFFAPEMQYCGDNGAMIALVGIEKLKIGDIAPLNIAPRPRWPLDQNSTPIALKNGWGKKGAKS
jgi:N6-L-threonylcarbamoyladenine synthase